MFGRLDVCRENFLGGQNTLAAHPQCYSWVGNFPPCPLGSRAFGHRDIYPVTCGSMIASQPRIERCYQQESQLHWRQPRRGCRGHIPQYFGWGDVNGNIPPILYVLSDIADQYWLPSVRSASRFHSAIRRHQFASARQTDSRLKRLVPPTLNSR